ncbi:hypothetical protein [uncultured Muribaculum sp.]|uniref:hypothetical protein n=1 Tax=uncultured Muribaculum sp. TaxID=1918613 RepID=UPI002630E6E2|nr:hypothetical protein [uncultured Muribaculum sp.]
MKVLIISNYFYPVNKIGALRINAFAKYFHLAGHSVTVLTEGEKDECVQWGGCQVHYVKDPVMTDAYLWRSISERKRWLPRRIAASLLRRVFLDEKRIWQVKAFKKARELFRQNVFDVVLSSFFPFGTAPYCNEIA